MIKLNNNHVLDWCKSYSSDSGEPYIEYKKYFKNTLFKSGYRLNDMINTETLFIVKGNVGDIILSDTKDNNIDFGELRISEEKLYNVKTGIDLKIVLEESFNNESYISYHVYSECEFVKSFESFNEAFEFAFI